MSAYARAHDIEHTVVGKPMDFWKQQMPKAMLLRSRCDWHLDPLEEHTIEHYLGTINLRAADVEPLSPTFYLDYCDWFTKQKDIEIDDVWVDRLDYDENTRSFNAILANGEAKRRFALRTLKKSLDTNTWPAYPGTGIHTLDLPYYSRFDPQE